MGKLFKKLFYIPKHEKIQEKTLRIHGLITVLITVFCLAAISLSSFAYFTSNVSSGITPIQSASIQASVQIEADNDSVAITAVDDRSCTAVLLPGKTYQVTLTHTGSASTGFYVVSPEYCPAGTYHTQQMFREVAAGSENRQSITFPLTVTGETTVTFTAHWGTSSHYANYQDKGVNDSLYIVHEEPVNMEIIGNPNATPREIYTVQPGDNLSEIALAYNTTVDALVAFNGFSSTDDIAPGQKIGIPPENWQSP